MQGFLFRKDLNPDGELMEGVIGTLIYGIKSVCAQTKYTMEQITMIVKDEYPELAKLIRLCTCRYVDDLAKSSSNREREYLLIFVCSLNFVICSPLLWYQMVRIPFVLV